MGRDVPNFWWVNQNKTYRQETNGGYLWSPKRNRTTLATLLRPHAPGRPRRHHPVLRRHPHHRPSGIATSHCYEAPKPTEFGKAGDDWSAIGWRVDVTYQISRNPLRPADHMQALASLLPERYSPLQLDGHGLQRYLTTLPPTVDVPARAADRRPGVCNSSKRPHPSPATRCARTTPSRSAGNDRLVADLRHLATVTETEREQLIDARVGQGRFRALVYDREKACRVTHVDRPEHLIASHIRPWRHSNNASASTPRTV